MEVLLLQVLFEKYKVQISICQLLEMTQMSSLQFKKW